MKKILVLFTMSIILFQTYAQKTETEKITEIRAWYKEIVSELDSYEKEMIEDSEQSAEGGMIYYYLNGDAIKMIKAEYYGESGNVKFSYYFRKGKLFFMFRERKSYDVPIYVDESGKGTMEEDRFYFYDDVMIRWLDKEKNKVNISSEEFSKHEMSILKDAYEYYNKLKK